MSDKESRKEGNRRTGLPDQQRALRET